MNNGDKRFYGNLLTQREELPVPGTAAEGEKLLRALIYLHRDAHGERVITAELLALMTGFSVPKVHELMRELEDGGYANRADGGWKWSGKNI